MSNIHRWATEADRHISSVAVLLLICCLSFSCTKTQSLIIYPFEPKPLTAEEYYGYDPASRFGMSGILSSTSFQPGSYLYEEELKHLRNEGDLTKEQTTEDQ